MEAKHILLATDLSDGSLVSHAVTAALAKLLGARVTLFHADEFANFAYHTGLDLGQYIERGVVARDEALERERAHLARLGVEVRVEVEAGRPIPTILHYAEAHGVDLIVSNRHRMGRGLLGLGSVTARLLRHAGIPVLAVPDASEDPGGAEAKELAIKRILFCTDFSKDSARAFVHAQALAKKARAALEVLHVLRIPTYVPVVPGEPAVGLNLSGQKILDAWGREELERFVADADDSVERILRIGSSEADEIASTAAQRASDLVLLPSHGRGALSATLLGSTAERVVKLSPVPTLVLPRPWLQAEA